MATAPLAPTVSLFPHERARQPRPGNRAWGIAGVARAMGRRRPRRSRRWSAPNPTSCATFSATDPEYPRVPLRLAADTAAHRPASQPGPAATTSRRHPRQVLAATLRRGKWNPAAARLRRRQRQPRRRETPPGSSASRPWTVDRPGRRSGPRSRRVAWSLRRASGRDSPPSPMAADSA